MIWGNGNRQILYRRLVRLRADLKSNPDNESRLWTSSSLIGFFYQGGSYDPRDRAPIAQCRTPGMRLEFICQGPGLLRTNPGGTPGMPYKEWSLRPSLCPP